jgi:3-deoxy-manno-octulosonate cytidylyltransferase (CMP-KDO synthetase)
MIVGVIPARYASTRLPGKPLIDLAGQPMIERVWRAASQAHVLDRILVATDDQRIAEVVRGFGGDVELTASDLPSGTDRCYAAVMQRGWTPDIVVNIQGDEPLLDPVVINGLVELLQSSGADVATPVQRITEEERQLPSVVKAVVNSAGIATAFTRNPVPTPWKHIGIYAYTWAALESHITKAPSQMEGAERLEQLRLLEAGARYACLVTNAAFMAVDTAEDAERVRRELLTRG